MLNLCHGKLSLAALAVAAIACGCGKPSPKSGAAGGVAPTPGATAGQSPADVPSALPAGMHVVFSPKDATGKDLTQAKLMAVGPQGEILVVEDSEQRKAMYKYSAEGKLTRTWDSLTYGVNKYTFFFPMDIAMDGTGGIYLCDIGFYWVNKFDADGSFVKTIAGRAVPESGIPTPGRVNLDKDGKVYVTQGESTKIHKFLPDGTAAGVWETAVPELPEHKGIADVAVDGLGNLYVLSASANAILSLNAEGKFVRSWKVKDCSSVEASPSGGIYVSGVYVIQKYNAEGKLLAEWKTGDDNPSFSVCAIGADPKGGLWVMDQVMEFDPVRFKSARLLHVD